MQFLNYDNEKPIECGFNTSYGGSACDNIRLKGLEEMVETYYKSGQFSNTVKVLCKQFDRPFLLFEALSDEYHARKMHEKKHSREAQYQFIRDFAAARTTLDDILVRQVLTLDYYLRDYARKRPSFALEQDSYKEEIRAVCLKAFPESSYKYVIRDYHTLVLLAMCFPLTGALRTFTFKINARAERTDTPTRVLANGRGFLRHGRTPQRAITSPLHPVTSLPLSRLLSGCFF